MTPAGREAESEGRLNVNPEITDPAQPALQAPSPIAPLGFCVIPANQRNRAALAPVRSDDGSAPLVVMLNSASNIDGLIHGIQ